MNKFKIPTLRIIILIGVMQFFSPAVKAQHEDIFKDVSIESVLGLFHKEQRDSIIKELKNRIFSSPDLFDDAFNKLVEKLKGKPKLYTFIRDLNIDFKSFQDDNLPVSLGLAYKYNNSWVRIKETGKATLMQSFDLGATGNIAFRKQYNPNDFLEFNFDYEGTFLFGGRYKRLDTASRNFVQRLQMEIAQRLENDQPYEHLSYKLDSVIQVTDQFGIGAKGKIGFESNQDFTKKQFAPGFLITMGAKGWNKKGQLKNFNILDYPFALIRLLTGTDKQFTVYGASIPSVLFGLDYVIPANDAQREALLGNLDPFSRLRFEAGFKTRVARIKNHLFHFSANFRWYKELNAEQVLKDNDLDKFTYFVAAIESSTGLFASYSTGRLPFDRQGDKVYEIGFRYNLGNKD